MTILLIVLLIMLGCSIASLVMTYHYSCKSVKYANKVVELLADYRASIAENSSHHPPGYWSKEASGKRLAKRGITQADIDSIVAGIEKYDREHPESVA